MLSNSTKIYLYTDIINNLRKELKEQEYTLSRAFYHGLVSGYRGAFIGDIAFKYLFDAIENYDIEAIKSLLWFDCDVRA